MTLGTMLLPGFAILVLVIVAFFALFKSRVLVTLGALVVAALVGFAAFAGFALLLAAPAPEQIGYLNIAGYVIGTVGLLCALLFFMRLRRR